MAGWLLAFTGAVGVAVGAFGGLVMGRRARGGRARREPWALRHSLVVLVAGVLGAIGAFALTYRAIDGDDKDRFDVAIKAATAVAALAAGLLTWGRLELSRHDHRLGVDRDLTERYSRSIDQLGSSEELVRVGGIFALERFALDAFALGDAERDIDWRMALDVLAALARKVSKEATRMAGQERDEFTAFLALTDVEEAVRVLGRFARRSGSEVTRRHNLSEVRLSSAYLFGTNLTNANLKSAFFVSAFLAAADLERSDLSSANLTDVNLSHANMAGTFLNSADLSGANLASADLRSADVTEADLTGASLTDADLTDANLTDANLAGSRLVRCNLAGANLTNANLTGADLTDVRYDADTVWPQNFEPPSPSPPSS